MLGSLWQVLRVFQGLCNCRSWLCQCLSWKGLRWSCLGQQTIGLVVHTAMLESVRFGCWPVASGALCFRRDPLVLPQHSQAYHVPSGFVPTPRCCVCCACDTWCGSPACLAIAMAVDVDHEQVAAAMQSTHQQHTHFSIPTVGGRPCIWECSAGIIACIGAVPCHVS
jgi:hypothetical protein